MQSRKAVSPVISTVILVAVAITVAVAVAYWMGGIAGQYTKFEKVEVQTGICQRATSGGNWTITMKLKNSGTAASTLIGCFINEIEVDSYDPFTPPVGTGLAATNMTSSETIESGATAIICIYIDAAWGAPVTSGTTVNIKIHSAGGMDYIKLIELV
jgi:flagellin-like protein